MDPFYPFIHKRERKEEVEPQPLYVELYPPPPPKRDEEEEKEEQRVIIIEIL